MGWRRICGLTGWSLEWAGELFASNQCALLHPDPIVDSSLLRLQLLSSGNFDAEFLHMILCDSKVIQSDKSAVAGDKAQQ